MVARRGGPARQVAVRDRGCGHLTPGTPPGIYAGVITHVIPRTALPENDTLGFEIAGAHYVLADVDGEVLAFAVTGPAARALDRAVVAEGRFRCPLHGWPIDPDDGRCHAGERCSYERLPVELVGSQIRVSLPGS